MTQGDMELLQQFARDHAQDAFSELVRRHLSLVYSAAHRLVQSPQLAEEVAQSVFIDLASNAHKLKADTTLVAWLHAVTRRTAIDAIRRESRRQARERTAAEMDATNPHEPDWREIEPILDEALTALEEPDRVAVLLRFFQNKSLREVGASLGVSDDTAQKRVSRAVEKLRTIFFKKNITVGVGSLGILLAANAGQAAPAGLAVSISAAAITAAAVSGPTIIAATTKAIVMTTLQKTIVALTVVTLAGTGLYEAQQAARVLTQNQALQQQQSVLSKQLDKMQEERDRGASQLAELNAEIAAMRERDSELVRLREEVAVLRRKSDELVDIKRKQKQNGNENIQLQHWSEQTKRLAAIVSAAPDFNIPDLGLLKGKDWFDAVVTDQGELADLSSDVDRGVALYKLRSAAKNNVASVICLAVDDFAKANSGRLPAQLKDLNAYFKEPLNAEILQRYRLLVSGTLDESDNETVLVSEASRLKNDDYKINITRRGWRLEPWDKSKK